MADLSVGTAGTLRITDDGTRVRFYVLCGDPATNIQFYKWYGTVNGVSVGGTVDLNAGFGSKLLGEWVVSTSQTVKLGQQATGTQGLGGAASFTAAISRPLPNAPTGVQVTRVSDSQHTLNWSRTSSAEPPTTPSHRHPGWRQRMRPLNHTLLDIGVFLFGAFLGIGIIALQTLAM